MITRLFFSLLFALGRRAGSEIAARHRAVPEDKGDVSWTEDRSRRLAGPRDRDPLPHHP